MAMPRRKLALYGLGGLAAAGFLVAITAAAIYVSAAFVVRYANLSTAPTSASGPQAAAR